MSFYIRDYSSEEKYDLAKFLNFENDVYDVLNSPFLSQINQLQAVDYYYVDNGYRDIDMIATDYYGDQFFAYLIQYYNGDFRTTFPEGTVLKMFSPDDLAEVFRNLSAQSNISNGEDD